MICDICHKVDVPAGDEKFQPTAEGKKTFGLHGALKSAPKHAAHKACALLKVIAMYKDNGGYKPVHNQTDACPVCWANKVPVRMSHPAHLALFEPEVPLITGCTFKTGARPLGPPRKMCKWPDTCKKMDTCNNHHMMKRVDATYLTFAPNVEQKAALQSYQPAAYTVAEHHKTGHTHPLTAHWKKVLVSNTAKKFNVGTNNPMMVYDGQPHMWAPHHFGQVRVLSDSRQASAAVSMQNNPRWSMCAKGCSDSWWYCPHFPPQPVKDEKWAGVWFEGVVPTPEILEALLERVKIGVVCCWNVNEMGSLMKRTNGEVSITDNMALEPSSITTDEKVAAAVAAVFDNAPPPQRRGSYTVKVNGDSEFDYVLPWFLRVSTHGQHATIEGNSFNMPGGKILRVNKEFVGYTHTIFTISLSNMAPKPPLTIKTALPKDVTPKSAPPKMDWAQFCTDGKDAPGDSKYATVAAVAQPIQAKCDLREIMAEQAQAKNMLLNDVEDVCNSTHDDKDYEEEEIQFSVPHPATGVILPAFRLQKNIILELKNQLLTSKLDDDAINDSVNIVAGRITLGRIKVNGGDDPQRNAAACGLVLDQLPEAARAVADNIRKKRRAVTTRMDSVWKGFKQAAWDVSNDLTTPRIVPKMLSWCNKPCRTLWHVLWRYSWFWILLFAVCGGIWKWRTSSTCVTLWNRPVCADTYEAAVARSFQLQDHEPSQSRIYRFMKKYKGCYTFQHEADRLFSWEDRGCSKIRSDFNFDYAIYHADKGLMQQLKESVRSPRATFNSWLETIDLWWNGEEPSAVDQNLGPSSVMVDYMPWEFWGLAELLPLSIIAVGLNWRSITRPGGGASATGGLEAGCAVQANGKADRIAMKRSDFWGVSAEGQQVLYGPSASNLACGLTQRLARHKNYYAKHVGDECDDECALGECGFRQFVADYGEDIAPAVPLKPIPLPQYVARFPPGKAKALVVAHKQLKSRRRAVIKRLHRFSPIVKLENSGLIRKKHVKVKPPRIVLSCTPHLNVCLGPTCVAASEQLKKTWGAKSPIVYTPGSTNAQIGEQMALYANWDVYEGDFAKFEANRRPETFLPLTDFIQRSGLDVMTASGSTVVELITADQNIVGRDTKRRVFAHLVSILKTGSTATTVGNSMLTGFVCFYNFCVANALSPRVALGLVKIFVCGDDSLVFVKPGLSYNGEASARLGLQLELTRRMRLEDATFCSQQVVRVTDPHVSYRLVPQLARFVTRGGWLADPPVAKGSLAWWQIVQGVIMQYHTNFPYLPHIKALWRAPLGFKAFLAGCARRASVVEFLRRRHMNLPFKTHSDPAKLVTIIRGSAEVAREIAKKSIPCVLSMGCANLVLGDPFENDWASAVLQSLAHSVFWPFAEECFVSAYSYLYVALRKCKISIPKKAAVWALVIIEIVKYSLHLYCSQKPPKEWLPALFLRCFTASYHLRREGCFTYRLNQHYCLNIFGSTFLKPRLLWVGIAAVMWAAWVERSDDRRFMLALFVAVCGMMAVAGFVGHNNQAVRSRFDYIARPQSSLKRKLMSKRNNVVGKSIQRILKNARSRRADKIGRDKIPKDKTKEKPTTIKALETVTGSREPFDKVMRKLVAKETATLDSKSDLKHSVGRDTAAGKVPYSGAVGGPRYAGSANRVRRGNDRLQMAAVRPSSAPGYTEAALQQAALMGREAAGAASASVGVSYATTKTTRKPNITYSTGARRGCRIRHTEPFGPISGTTTYFPASTPVNPGNVLLHPWLGAFAGAFDLYCYHKLTMVWREIAPTSYKGEIGVNFDYEPTDPAPTTQQLFEEQMGTVTGPPWKPLRCSMHVPSTMHQQFYFIAGGNATGLDPRVTNQAQVQFFTNNCADTTVIGEWWVEYDVELFETTGFGASSGSNNSPANWVAGAAGATGTAMTNLLLAGLTAGSNPSFALVAGTANVPAAQTVSVKILLPYSTINSGFITPIQGTYLITAAVRSGQNGGGCTSATSLTNCAVHSINSNGFNQGVTFMVASSIATTPLVVRVDVTSTTPVAANPTFAGYPSVECTWADSAATDYLNGWVEVQRLGPVAGGLLINQGRDTKNEAEFLINTRSGFNAFDGPVFIQTEKILRKPPLNRMLFNDWVMEKDGQRSKAELEAIQIEAVKELNAIMAAESKGDRKEPDRSNFGATLVFEPPFREDYVNVKPITTTPVAVGKTAQSGSASNAAPLAKGKNTTRSSSLPRQATDQT